MCERHANFEPILKIKIRDSSLSVYLCIICVIIIFAVEFCAPENLM